MDHASPDHEFRAPSIEELQPLFPAYEITGFIAQGGMGAVYAARQVSLDRAAAIKILPRQFGEDAQFRSSFEAEAKAMARLHHPNLIGVYDFGEVDGMLFIIMEMVKGKSLHHSMHGKLIEQKEAARLVSGICRGLAHAHEAGILHRDIKPGNILLGPGAEPKIGDFGLARLAGDDHNPEEIVWGTPGYSAPELVDRPDTVDQRADIYSVGALLYELLTARLPSEPWQAPSALAKCDPAFDTIIRRAIHPSPELRYQDAEKIADELDALVERQQGGMVKRTVTAAASSTAAAPPTPSLAKSDSGHHWVLLGRLVIIVVLLGAIYGMTVVIKKKMDRRELAQKEHDEEVQGEKQEPFAPDIPERREKEGEAIDKPPVVHQPVSLDQPEPKPEPSEPLEPPKPAPDTPTVESPTEALARLKDKLKMGDLSEMPEGTAKRGDSHFFLVPSPLTWQAAMHFAEDHGAQLAVLSSREDLAWASGEFKPGTATWLGLSDSGTESKWFWVDGEKVAGNLWAPGQPDDSPSNHDGEDFAALLPGDTIDDLAAERELPFLLQWNADGENAGSLAAQIKRVGEALKQRVAPVFPAGTRNIGGSRFLLVPHAVSWDEAAALATAAGGHLAVPSSVAEATWITDTLQDLLGGGDGCWVGGRLAGAATPMWTFVTGERFQFVTWAPGQPDEGEGPQIALQVSRSADAKFGYNNSSGASGQAGSYLLEWSVTSRRNLPSKEERQRPAAVQDWLLALRRTTSDREQANYARFQRRHDKNVKDFMSDVERATATAREFSKEAGDLVDGFLEGVERDNHVPDDLGSERAKAWLGDVHERAVRKQESIFEDYQQQFEAAKDRYLAELTAEIERRALQVDKVGTAYLEREMDAITDDAYFKEILAGRAPDVP